MFRALRYGCWHATAVDGGVMTHGEDCGVNKCTRSEPAEQCLRHRPVAVTMGSRTHGGNVLSAF